MDNDMQSNNNDRPEIGARVYIREGFGRGGLGTVAAHNEWGTVDLFVDSDPEGSEHHRRNYSNGTYEEIAIPGIGKYVNEANGSGRWLVLMRELGNSLDVHRLMLVAVDETGKRHGEPFWRYLIDADMPVLLTREPAGHEDAALVMGDLLAKENARLKGLHERLSQMEARLTEQQAEHERVIRNLTRRAHEYADEHNLCEEFDQVMEELDLQPRGGYFNVDLEVRLNFMVTVWARNPDNAREIAAQETEGDGHEYEGLDKAVADYVTSSGYSEGVEIREVDPVG